MSKDFKEQDFAFDHLTDEELKKANRIYKGQTLVSKNRLWGSNITFLLGIIAITTSLYTGYSFVKKIGAKDAKIETLFELNNPVVKKNDLTKEINLVRRDMTVADTMVLRMSKTQYNSLNKDIKSINTSLIKLQKSSDKNLNRIIELIKSK